MTMIGKIDLHTHTHCSDGSLTPTELVSRAQQRGVEVLAITDHDTVAALDEANPVAASLGVTLLPSVEISSEWRDGGLHVVGLNIDPKSPALLTILDELREARRQRAIKIAEKLRRVGLTKIDERLSSVADASAFGRVHFAQWLVDDGIVKDQQEAFRKFLAQGRSGYVRSPSATLEHTVKSIVAAGGVACIAHPSRYKMSNGQMRKLLETFRVLGGQAVEVSTAGDNGQMVERMTDMARESGLLASVGSDFHSPGLLWRDLGKYLPLPERIEPVWRLWGY